MIKILNTFLLISLVFSIGYVYFEPEIIAAADDTKKIDVTLSVTSEITLTSPGNIAMSRAITMTTRTATGGDGVSWLVKTNNQAGYKLELKGDRANIMYDGGTTEYFTDYTEATAGVPETWSVASGDYEFGFSVFGTDTPTATWGTDSDCVEAAHVPSSTLKYQGFKSVTAIQVATRAAKTPFAGITTTMCVAAEQGTAVYAPSGSYTANVTGTATTL